MKKLLITGLCVLGLYSIPDARASNIAALPLDNTHQVLVPEMPQSVSGSYQVARTYFMPDYQKELTGKRVNDGGAGPKGKKTCEQYGKKSFCEPKIGKGVSHPLPGLTCYDECVDCSTYGKVPFCLSSQVGVNQSHPIAGLTCYDKCVDCSTYGKVASCPSPKVGVNPSSPVAGLTCYDRCACPSKYKYTESNCIAPAKLGGDVCFNNNVSASNFPSTLTSSTQSTGTLYTDCTCPAEYKYNSKLSGETCWTCMGSKGTKYKCTTCTGYTLIVCPPHGECSQCLQDLSKLKLVSCDASKGWKMSADGLSCEAMSCPVGYSSNTTRCQIIEPDLVCSGMSGGKQCCKCVCDNINSSCTETNYPYTFVPSNATETGKCSTGCGSNKVIRYQIKCNSGYVLKNGKCLSDTCPTGYNKTACASGYKQTGTKPTEAGTTCYQCKNDTCQTGYSKTACTSGQKQTTATTEAGTTCYQCVLKTCKDYGYLDADPQDGRTCTKFTVENLTCYTDCTYKNSGGSGGGACDEDEITLRNVCVHRCPGGEPIDGNVAPDWCHNCCGYSATTWKNPRWTGKCCTNNTTNYQKPGNNLTDVGTIY